MKRLLTSILLAGAIAASTGAQANTWDEIRDKVIQPCLEHKAAELDLPPEHLIETTVILFAMDRDYYEGVIDGVEDALRKSPNKKQQVFDAGIAACIQNQGSWEKSEDDGDC